MPIEKEKILSVSPERIHEKAHLELEGMDISGHWNRMFEQRVLNAYRERVAQERQLQLLRELEDEDKLTKEKEAKKQSQNQRKKDKKKSLLKPSSTILDHFDPMFYNHILVEPVFKY